MYNQNELETRFWYHYLDLDVLSQRSSVQGMKKNRWKVKGKDVDTGGNWIEVTGMFNYEHRFMEITGGFLPCSDIFKHP